MVRWPPVAYAERVNRDFTAELRLLFERTSPPGVVSLYVFGSHSEGRAHRESDLDVAVLLDRKTFGTSKERFEARLRLIGSIGSALGRNDVDLVVLNDVPPTFGARIVTRGARVFCSDSEADHSFVRDVQLRACDLEPFLRRMRHLKLEALKR